MPKNGGSRDLSVTSLSIAFVCLLLVGSIAMPAMAQEDTDSDAEHTITVESENATTSYYFRSTGRVQSGEQLESKTNDNASEYRGRGSVGADDTDVYHYDGRISLLLSNATDSLSVKIDGQSVPVEDLGSPESAEVQNDSSDSQPPHLITLTTPSEDLIEYNLSASDSLEKTGDVDTGERDRIDGRNTTGTVGRNGFDTYRYSGDIGSFSSTNPDGLTVYVDGDSIDPSSLGTGESSQSDTEESPDSDDESSDDSDQSTSNYSLRDMEVNPQPVQAGGEVTVNVTIANTADERIQTEIGMATEGEVADSVEVGLFPPGVREITFTHTYDSPGTYSIRIGGLNESGAMNSYQQEESIEVVSESASLSSISVNASTETNTSSNGTSPIGAEGGLQVAQLSPSQQSITAGQEATWELVITNNQTSNQTSTIAVRADANQSVIRKDTLTLGPDESQGVTFSHKFNQAGQHNITVGQQMANVTAVSRTSTVSVFQTSKPTSTPTATMTATPTPAPTMTRSGDIVTENNSSDNVSETSSDEGSGFGIVVGVLSLIVATLSIRRRHRS